MARFEIATPAAYEAALARLSLLLERPAGALQEAEIAVLRDACAAWEAKVDVGSDANGQANLPAVEARKQGRLEADAANSVGELEDSVNWISICGTVAALCSVISFVPQAWRIVKSRDTSSISPATYSLTVTGFALWTAYGVGLWQWPLILTNSICLVLSAFILFMTLLPQSKKEAAADAIDPSA